jgi:SAM-dependent methyltransferase
MDVSAEKLFYDKQFSRLPEELVDLERREREMNTRGDRYHCVADSLKNPGSLKVCEWGVGSVSRALLFDRMFGSYTALEISAPSIAALRKQKPDFDIRPLNLNADLPLEAGAFDATIALMVIEHLFDPFHSFREIARITKPSGLVLINLPLVTGIVNRLRLLRGELPITSAKEWFQYREWDGGHLHYFNYESVLRVAALSGLRLRKTYPVGRMSRVKSLAPQLLCSELSFVFEKPAA